MTNSDAGWPYSTAAALSLIVLLTAARVLVLFGTAPNLSFDEAQYWAWAQDFQFGYFSKPPMVAWSIIATTGVCGESASCIKLGALLAHGGTALAVLGLGSRLFGARTGFWAALTYAAMPAVSLSSMVITTDPFLLCFWGMALYGLVRALQDNAWRWWLVMGLGLGLGLLSKYAMAFFLLSLALLLVWSPRYRSHWRNSRLWAAMGLGIALYLPNLAWNASNGFVSYLHTKDNANLGADLFNFNKLMEFIGSQFGVFGPVLFGALLVMIALLGRVAKDERMKLLLAFTLPVLAIMTFQAFLSRANANWSAPAFVAASVAVAAWAVAQRRMWILKASLVLHLTAAGLLYFYDYVAPVVGLDQTARYDPMKRIRGWDQVGERVSTLLARHPGHKLLFDERKTMATLIYYVQPHPFDAVKWNPSGVIHDHYDQTTRLADDPPDLLYVTEEQDARMVAQYFERIEAVEDITVPLYPDYKLALKVFRLSGFKGY